jgi:hypothetical protein
MPIISFAVVIVIFKHECRIRFWIILKGCFDDGVIIGLFRDWIANLSWIPVDCEPLCDRVGAGGPSLHSKGGVVDFGLAFSSTEIKC